MAWNSPISHETFVLLNLIRGILLGDVQKWFHSLYIGLVDTLRQGSSENKGNGKSRTAGGLATCIQKDLEPTKN